MSLLAMPPVGRAAMAALITAGVTTLAIVASGPIDPPGERGLHVRPTPTAGGVAILLGTSVGALLLAATSGMTGGTPLAAALGMATVMGLVGAADDLINLGARVKLLTQLVLALGFSVLFARVEVLSTPLGNLILGPVGGALGSALWIVVAVNAVNFMDGADGLSPGTLVIALAALGLASRMGGAKGVGDLAIIGAAAGLGFLPWNLPGGRIFQGDAGSLFSGALLAGLTLIAAGKSGEAHVSLWFGPLVLLPLLIDVFLTLISRARRRAPLLQAHRDHLFQRWQVARRSPHGRLAIAVWLMTGLCSALGLALPRVAVEGRGAVFAIALAVGVGLWVALDRAIRTTG